MRLDGVWWLEDRLRQQLRPVPFEVPAGTSLIQVRLDYDRSAGAVLDLGCAGPEGFRGWSGGARQEFEVGAGRATPGYLPGEILPGVWHVWLGLHRVPPEGGSSPRAIVHRGERAGKAHLGQASSPSGGSAARTGWRARRLRPAWAHG